MQDYFLLKVLDSALNSIPDSSKKLQDMDEKEFGDWLAKQDFKEKRQPNFTIKLPQTTIESNPCCGKTDTLILPLSLENNATTTGTAAIIEQFGKEFGVPCEHDKEYLPFDKKGQTFDINAARCHQDFLTSLNKHKSEMTETIRQLTEAEKAFDPLQDALDESYSQDEDLSASNIQKVDAKFQNIFDSLVRKMWDAQQAGDVSEYDKFVHWMSAQRQSWADVTDHHGRTVLHAAVENGNMTLVKTLVSAGVDVNVKERCGAAPLTLAVIRKDEEMCSFLLNNFAVYSDYFFSTIPSPLYIAKQLNLKVVADMEERLKSSNSVDKELSKIFQHGEVVENCPNVSEMEGQSNSEEHYKYDRSNKGCRTLFVGDQGTNKVLRGVKSRSEAAYGWCSEVPGDMHAKGYLYEVCKKVMSPGGFMYIVREVLGRKKVTDDSFGQKKFQEQNLNRISEALRDVAFAFGMAAALEFRGSDSFPSQDLLRRGKREIGSHNLVLLNKFKEWIASRREDASFNYYSQMFNLFGPLQYLYEDAIKFGHGLGREAAWMLMHPLFAQANKRNYHTEAMVYIINFVAAWPRATRELLRHNCSVSLNGKNGHNIALDEWVESCVVQPMKNYATG